VRGQDLVHLATGVLLFVLALWVGNCPAQVEELSGLRPLEVPEVEGLENPPEAAKESVGPFFDERNAVRFRVPRKMTAGELIELYQVDFDHVRGQIAEQVGLGAFDPDFELEEGLELELFLTPPKNLLGGDDAP
jgi:hypothetical protein